MFSRRTEHHSDDGLAETLGHNRSVLREQRRKILSHLLHGGIPSVQRINRPAKACFYCALSFCKGFLCRLKASLCYDFHPVCSRRPCMGNIIRSLRKEFCLLLLCLSFHLMGGKRHPHSRGGIRPCALCNHIGNRFLYFLVSCTLDKRYFCRVNSAIQYSYFSIFVPCYILIPQHERQILIISFHHTSFLFYLPPNRWFNRNILFRQHVYLFRS